MKISVKASGGFAGLNQTSVGELDTKQLAAERANQIEQCIDALMKQEGAVGADMMRYDIDVEENGGKRHHIAVFDEGDSGSPIQQLLSLLNQ